MPSAKTQKSSIFYFLTFGVWYSLFFLSAVSNKGFVYASTISINRIASVSKMFAYVLLLLVLCGGIYCAGRKCSVWVMGIIGFDSFMSLSSAMHFAYGKAFWESVAGDYIAEFFISCFPNETADDIYFNIYTIIAYGLLMCSIIEIKHSNESRKEGTM